MALQTFKEVIQNKGYRISTQDREVFEQGNLQSFFGLSDYDVIEFIIYDINDNQLTQSSYGLVRYIPLTTQNIKDYILIPQGTMFQKYKFPKEYFIDAEQLLKEAGYTNGIFKTQITLLNKRAGSGDELTNKLWISEISPSRTEIRVYPLKKGLEEHKQLQERFNIFTTDKNFREDTINNAIPFIETPKADYVKELITNKYTAKWFDKLKQEFKISNFDDFATKVRNSFIQSCQYEFTNRYSKVGELNYGQPKSTLPNLSLSVDDILNTAKLILTQTINHYLIKQDVRETSTFDTGVLASFDEVTNILQRNEKDTVIDTSYPIIRQITTIASKQTPSDTNLIDAAKKEDPSISNPNPFVSTTIWNETAPKPVINNPYDGQIDTNRDAPQKPSVPVGAPPKANPTEVDANGNPTGEIGKPVGKGNTIPPQGGAISNPIEENPKDTIGSSGGYINEPPMRIGNGGGYLSDPTMGSNQPTQPASPYETL